MIFSEFLLTLFYIFLGRNSKKATNREILHFEKHSSLCNRFGKRTMFFLFSFFRFLCKFRISTSPQSVGGSIQGCILKIVSILRLHLVQHVLITLEKFWEAHSLGSWSHFWQKLTYQIGENRYFRQNCGFLHLLLLLFKLINEYCLTCLCISSVLTCLNSIYINIIWLFAMAEGQ